MGKQLQGLPEGEYSRQPPRHPRTEFRSVQPILRLACRSCRAYRLPVYRILRSLARVFQLNDLQALFLVHLLRSTNWDMRDKVIQVHSEGVRQCFGVSEQAELKTLILYLTVLCFSLKHFFSEQGEELLPEAVRIVPDFVAVFEVWSRKHAGLVRSVSPAVINRIAWEMQNSSRSEAIDHNLLADAIIQISPAYSQNRKQSEPPQPSPDLTEPTPLPKTQPPLLFSTSRLEDLERAGRSARDSPAMKLEELQFDYSVVGSSQLNRACHFSLGEDEDYCEQLNLGLQDGQSEEHIVLREEASLIPPSSYISFNPECSFNAERFLSFFDREFP